MVNQRNFQDVYRRAFGEKDNVKITKRYTVSHDDGWDVLDHGMLIVTFWEGLPDAKKRAEALAAELNEANKPRYYVNTEIGEFVYLLDRERDDTWVLSVSVSSRGYEKAKGLAEHLAYKLNSGELDNE